MVKYTCSNCYAFKKSKYFPVPQPYSDRTICDKCVNKHDRLNKSMVDTMRKRSVQPLMDSEVKAFTLSFDTLNEMKQTIRDNPKAGSTMKDLGNCLNRNTTREYLNKFNMTESTVDELVEYFMAIACVNNRLKARHAEAMQNQSESKK